MNQATLSDLKSLTSQKMQQTLNVLVFVVFIFCFASTGGAIFASWWLHKPDVSLVLIGGLSSVVAVSIAILKSYIQIIETRIALIERSLQVSKKE